MRVRTNRYGDLVVQVEAGDNERIEELLQRLSSRNQRSWVLLHNEDALQMLPDFLQFGCVFHSARDRQVTLRWCPPTLSPDPVPASAFTHLVANGLVLNSNEEILCVRQTYCSHGFWRLPGGCVDPGESLEEAAVREVKEETSIKTRPRGVLLFLEDPKLETLWGKGHLVAVVVLDCQPGEGEKQPVAQETEIAAARWVTPPEYTSPKFHTYGRFGTIMAALIELRAGRRVLLTSDKTEMKDEPFREVRIISASVPPPARSTAARKALAAGALFLGLVAGGATLWRWKDIANQWLRKKGSV